MPMTRPAAGFAAVVLALGLTATSVASMGPAASAAGPDVGPAGAPATVVPLQVTGPAEDRLNLVVLGDGYTAEELPKLREQVDQHLNVQWSIEPFRSYRNYFNVYLVEVASAESGISCDPDDGNVRRDTALHLEYAAQCPADPNARGITFGTGGQDALDGYLEAIPGVTEQNRQTLTLANTDTYGGIGGRNATTSGGNSLGPLISPHELGHSLGELQDEYPYYDRGVPGPAYVGGEPASAHHTTQTVAEMAQGQSKWWRWLGEESVAGGTIDRYESGMYSASGVWRPTRHSLMRDLGYAFDEVSREQLVKQISGRRDLGALAITTTPGEEVGPADVLWVETPQPTYHELEITWSVNGARLAEADQRRDLDLGSLDLAPGDEVEVQVQDPTEFVRDPAIRDSDALTARATWTIGDPLPATPVTAEFTASTQTGRPVGGQDVVYVQTSHPTDRVLDVSWQLDGEPLPAADGARTLDLGSQDLTEGTHTLTAVLSDPADPTATDSREWVVDHTPPSPGATLSEPERVLQSPGRPARHVYRENFDLLLSPTDDQDGYVVGEFRLDGDGWHHFYGWPDAPEGTPFQFTPTGTTIKEITYGALSPGGLTYASFDEPEPGYGTRLLEYRAIDAAGNISEPEQITVRVIPGER